MITRDFNVPRVKLKKKKEKREKKKEKITTKYVDPN